MYKKKVTLKRFFLLMYVSRLPVLLPVIYNTSMCFRNQPCQYYSFCCHKHCYGHLLHRLTNNHKLLYKWCSNLPKLWCTFADAANLQYLNSSSSIYLMTILANPGSSLWRLNIPVGFMRIS